MKKTIYILLLLAAGFTSQAQTAITKYQFATVTAMKAYYGSAKEAYVVATGKNYIICSACVADEATIFAGAGGRKWQLISTGSTSAADLTSGTLDASRLPATAVQTTTSQTLTNKTISGASNTLTNIPASAIAPADTVNFQTSVAAYLQGLPGYAVGKVLQADMTWVTPASTPTYQAPQNLARYTEEFSQTPWNNTGGSVTVDQIVAPDGTSTADIYTTGTTSYDVNLRQLYTFTAEPHTLSVYVKRNNHDYIGLRIQNSHSGEIYPFVNLATLATNTQGVAGATMGVVYAGNGWYRIWLTYTPTAGASFFDLAITQSTGNTAYTPAGTEKVYYWGAQLNTGTIARPYLKTLATAVL